MKFFLDILCSDSLSLPPPLTSMDIYTLTISILCIVYGQFTWWNTLKMFKENTCFSWMKLKLKGFDQITRMSMDWSSFDKNQLSSVSCVDFCELGELRELQDFLKSS